MKPDEMKTCDTDKQHRPLVYYDDNGTVVGAVVHHTDAQLVIEIDGNLYLTMWSNVRPVPRDVPPIHIGASLLESHDGLVLVVDRGGDGRPMIVCRGSYPYDYPVIRPRVVFDLHFDTATAARVDDTRNTRALIAAGEALANALDAVGYDEARFAHIHNWNVAKDHVVRRVNTDE